MTAEYQSLNEVSKIESSIARPSGAQAEAINLMYSDHRVSPRANTQLPVNLEMPDIYGSDDSFQSIANAAKGGRWLDNAVGSCSTDKPACESERNWRVDTERRTPGAREWDKQAESQRQKPLDRNADGSYTVKPGDSLSDIARRMLKGDGSGNPTHKDVADAGKKIYEANPEIGCNPDLIRPGMKLRLPGVAEKDSAPEKQKPTDGGRQDERREGHVTPGKGFESQEPRRGERTRPPELKAPRPSEQSDITDQGTDRSSDCPNDSRASGKSMEQRLQEMRECLESMKRTLEDLQARKLEKPGQAGQTDEPQSEPTDKKVPQSGESRAMTPEEEARFRELMRKHREKSRSSRSEWHLISDDSVASENQLTHA